MEAWVGENEIGCCVRVGESTDGEGDDVERDVENGEWGKEKVKNEQNLAYMPKRKSKTSMNALNSDSIA
ncbi:hypothetical protein OCU04_010770 [Sclerotinia nivalis]|uniref:Uncharacterized protein n=1 Tax=Sclerotinia nivalis TaxID=352851 RepID=A0A9X0ADN5_9HELO|nr:hypothetical protein OCU04_010770 [Sclerotinia nivalis]